MNIGILWFDSEKNKTLHAKVREAAQYFRRKFDRIPELVLVNPKDLVDGSGSEKGFALDVFNEFVVTIKPRRYVLPSHMWIGTDDLPEYAQENAEANAKQVREVAA